MKAWGINIRQKIEFDANNPDDIAYLTDGELGDAPVDPGTYEGNCSKPRSPREMNKWCARECERSDTAITVDKIVLPDYSKRVFNQPWKHGQTNETR